MEIFSCAINVNLVCITGWVLSNLVWVLLIFLLIFFRSLVTAPFVAWKLLRKNRASQGSGFGTLAADLFVAVWKSDKRCDENLNQCIVGAGQISQRDIQTERVANEYLVPQKLVRIEMVNGVKRVRAIKNFRNRAIRWWIIRGLVWKYDDDLNVYRS